jgi:hypothetical protein
MNPYSDEHAGKFAWIGIFHLVMLGISSSNLSKYNEKKDDTSIHNSTKNAVLGIGITSIVLAFISFICIGIGGNIRIIAFILFFINFVLTIIGLLFTSSLSPPPPPKPNPNPNPK